MEDAGALYNASPRQYPRARAKHPSGASRIGAARIREDQARVFIIRENRTYDQVFGDIQSGDGDPNLTLFGQAVTPNAHRLAAQTVLLDNLYCNGEVSEDGHQWCQRSLRHGLHGKSIRQFV